MGAVAGELAIARTDGETAATVDAGEIRIEPRGVLDRRATQRIDDAFSCIGDARRKSRRLLSLLGDDGTRA
jgi:hypothetical protein